MKVISRLMMLFFVLSLSVFVYAQNNEKNMQSSENEVKQESHLIVQNLETKVQGVILPESTPQLSWCGTGPYGQVDVVVTGGSSPFKYYRGSTLLRTTSLRSLTLAVGCNGGLLTVKDSNNNEAWGIVPQGCYDHGCE